MIRKTNLECSLQQIANTILLNTRQINNLGLLDGKIGITLFLYHYSQINGNSIYRNYADELFDEIFNNLYDTMPADFSNGLTGIGWCIQNLLKNKIIAVNYGKILEEIDATLKNVKHSDILRDINIECPFCSKGIYFLERNKKNRLEDILNILNQTLDQNTKVLSLSYLNSILYIILQEKKNWRDFTDLTRIIYTNIIDSINNKQYTFPDILLLTNLIEKIGQIEYINSDKEKWGILLKTLDYNNFSGIFNIGIYNLIYDKIQNEYSIISSKLENTNIENQINCMIKDVYRNLNLFNGLAGIGLTLCNYFYKQHEAI